MSSPLPHIARQTPLSTAEFSTLVVAQFTKLQALFPKTHRSAFKDFPCLWDGDHGAQNRSIALDGAAVDAPEGLSTNLTGLFYRQPYNKIVRHGTVGNPHNVVAQDGTLVLYGLTDAREWMLAYVEFHYDSGYKDRGRHIASTVIMKRATPEDIATAAGLPAEQMLFQVWKDVARRLATEMTSALTKAQTTVSVLETGLHELRLATEWMKEFHPEKIETA